MSYPFTRGLGYPQSVREISLGDLAEEIVRARTKFPKPDGLIPALVEELAEWADETDPGKRRNELLQVACVAMRLYEETDPFEDMPTVVTLKRLVANLEPIARTALQVLCGDEAAARSVVEPE